MVEELLDKDPGSEGGREVLRPVARQEHELAAALGTVSLPQRGWWR